MNRREQILAGVFLAAILGAAGIFAWLKASQHWQTQRRLLELKREQIAEAQSWLDSREEWLARDRWVAATAPTLYEGQKTEADFFQSIQTSLDQYGVKIVEQRIQETKGGGGGVFVGIDLTLDSPLENLIRWIHTVQQPAAFRMLSRVRLKSDPATANIRAEISLRQYFDSSPHTGIQK